MPERRSPEGFHRWYVSHYDFVRVRCSVSSIAFAATLDDLEITSPSCESLNLGILVLTEPGIVISTEPEIFITDTQIEPSSDVESVIDDEPEHPEVVVEPTTEEVGERMSRMMLRNLLVDSEVDVIRDLCVANGIDAGGFN